MWTHREMCNNCEWRGYNSELNKRYPTDEENRQHGADNPSNKKYVCCPKCGSFDVEGFELEDSHLQGI